VNDDFEVGPIAPRPARPVSKATVPPEFALAEDWAAVANTGSAAGAGVDPDIYVVDDPAVLTKAEAIQLAKLIVLYPFLSKVL
jgi:hypothetical protein